MGFVRNKEFWAGLIFTFFGVSALVLSHNYEMGTAMDMGPGFFPSVLGAILTLLGVIISVRGLWPAKERLDAWRLRPLMVVVCSVVAFGLLVKTIGLILSILMLILTSFAAGLELRVREVVALFLVMVTLVAGLFVYLLELPFNLWPS